jgi:hypothetical protein
MGLQEAVGLLGSALIILKLPQELRRHNALSADARGRCGDGSDYKKPF